MFTGIIEELGTLREENTTSTGKQFMISARKVLDDLTIGESISVNGVCLTVVHCDKKSLCLDLVHETLDKSNLGGLKIGAQMNLERALKLSTRLGGHILQGHVETVGVILEKEKDGDGAIITVRLDKKWMKYCVPKGSIALDGISLTIASASENIIKVALIPHTLEQTTLGIKDKSATLNIETDIIGKYIESLLHR